MKPLRGALIGCGYFSRFHLDAWSRVPGVTLEAVCDLDLSKAGAAAAAHRIAQAVDDPDVVLALDLDFVDVATPPGSHLALVRRCAGRVPAVLLQKPLAPDVEAARRIAFEAARAKLRLMVHENFRFQPWHREIRRLLEGRTLHGISVRTRMGDGWRPEAYLDRQPYFRDMERLLVFETGVHVADVFRFLGGEIEEVYAVLRRLNPAIKGEDTGLVSVRFKSGALGVWDASRWHESTAADPRLTFGEWLVETDAGAIRLDAEGRLFVKPLDQAEREHAYAWERRGFAGDCVHATLSHFADRLRDGGPFETDVDKYLRTFDVQEAIYRSASENRPVRP